MEDYQNDKRLKGKAKWKTNFQPREFPRSGSKAKDVKEEKDRKLVITMTSYSLQTPHRMAHASRQDQIFVIRIRNYDDLRTISSSRLNSSYGLTGGHFVPNLSGKCNNLFCGKFSSNTFSVTQIKEQDTGISPKMQKSLKI